MHRHLKWQSGDWCACQPVKSAVRDVRHADEEVVILHHTRPPPREAAACTICSNDLFDIDR